MPITRLSDLSIPRADQEGAPRPDGLLGRWLNTDPGTAGILEAVLASGPEGLTLRVAGAGDGAPVDWGTTPLELVYNMEEEDGRPTVAASASFEPGFMTVHLQIRLNRGVLVIAHFTRFQDGSGRSNYFGREFFYRVSGP